MFVARWKIPAWRKADVISRHHSPFATPAGEPSRYDPFATRAPWSQILFPVPSWLPPIASSSR